MTEDSLSRVSLEFNRHIINLLDSLSAVSELAALSIERFDEGELLKHALEALMANQDMERCSIFLLGAGNRLTNAAGLDWDDMLGTLRPHEPARHANTEYRLGEGIMGRAAASGATEHCQSCADDARFLEFFPCDPPIQGALLCVPIQCEGRVLGVLNVFHPQPGFFNMWHERLVLLFCQVLGRLLLNHRFTHHLGQLLDDRTREVMASNAALREEAARRQAAQDELEHQYSFLQTVMDSAPEPMMVIGRDYRLLMTNALARHSAMLQGESEPTTCYQLSHHRDTPCDGAEHQCPLQTVLEQGGPVTVVHEHYRADGEVRQIELLASPLRDKADVIIGIIESARDITERKEAELAIRAARDYAENLIRTANVLVVELDAAGQLKVFNPAAEAVTGYSLAELEGRNWFEVLVPRERYPKVWAEFDRLMKDGLPSRFENPILTKSGQERYIAWQNSVLHEHGKPSGIVSFGMDITDRKQAELEYKTLLQTATDGYLLIDAEGRLLDTNAACCEMLGYRSEELLRLRLADIDAVESPDQQSRHFEEIHQQGYARFESRHIRKDQRIIDVEVSVTFLDVRGGMLVAFIRDITERKSAELQIRQLAYYDTLTNLPNRRLLTDRIGHALDQAKRYQRALAVMFLDLDRFKQVNDTLGHDAGDELLKQVAKRLSACVRAGDTVARPGGDEFVIVLAEVNQPDDAALVAEKVIASLNEPVPVLGHMLSITTSIGIAVYPVNGTDDIQELMKKADLAMYQAKEAGRNGYQFFNG